MGTNQFLCFSVCSRTYLSHTFSPVVSLEDQRNLEMSLNLFIYLFIF